ncbi:MAG: YfjI family protein [Methanothrix sp.]|jgi:hypothetical protein|uniref:DUF3987 domain-containing protein n=1 Tax=Methanothrix sp. TaxID=90426 RepID=UPI0025F5F316|nr:DUF3987 domain-containing protein [Methanothrix sp.]MCK9404983.1 YfjI family protein [Methanothrix sp.]MCK9564527.1 YfjI family protein [Methanothrix sp.]
MADIPEVFNQPGAAFVLLPDGIKFPPIEKEWQRKGHSFQEAAAHKGNVGIMAGNGYLGLDQDDPSAFEGLELPITCTWETRPGRLGLWFKASDEIPEALAGISKKANQAQLKLFKNGKPCGEVKLERTYQVIPPSWKKLEDGTRADYKLLQDAPPAEIRLAELLEDLQAIGITFSSKLESNAKKLEDMGKKAHQRRAESDEARSRRYAEAALESEVKALGSSEVGNRNDQLNRSSFALGQFVAAGVLSEAEVIRALSKAAIYAGLEMEEIRATITSGLEAGTKHPRDIPTANASTGTIWDDPEVHKEFFKENPLTREKADEIEARTGTHIFNAVDDPKQNGISEEELNAYSLPEGPKFECNLPKDHFIQRFMAYGTDISDAYIEYWFAAGLFALAVIADKKVKVELKQGIIYPNLYISINGKSSLARKSTVVDKAEAMLCQVKPSLLPAMVPTEFSPEAFTEHMSDYNHATWVRDEAAGVLSLMKKDYMRGFKDSLMQLYDSKPFYRKLRTSQRKGAKREFRVDDPYLNLLWATTDASLGANTEQNDALSGFMARFLFFFPQGNKTKWLPLEEGTTANSIFEGVARDQLAEISAKIGELRECQAMHFSPEAARYYTEWQRVREQEWTASNDGNAMQIYSRLAPTVIKLSMLFEVGMPGFVPSGPMRVEFIEEACRLVDSYLMPTARAVYDLVGANAEKNVIDRIIAYLKKHNGKATRREILKDVKIKSGDFTDYLSTMIESGMVESKTVMRSGKGRDSVYIFLCSVSNVANVAKVANVANVEEIHPDDKGGKEETMATLATMDTLSTSAAKELDGGKTAIEKPANDDPGFRKFKGRMKKRTCCFCGRQFAYDLTPYYGKDQTGYICATCHMEGPPSEPEKVDSQTKLEAGA